MPDVLRTWGIRTSVVKLFEKLDGNPVLIEYPTDFPIKIMGRREPHLVKTIVEIVQRHAPDFDESTVEMRTSKKNNYLSVTCTVRATSREQLDALYRDLCDHPAVVMVL